jgi:hypothetical protein
MRRHPAFLFSTKTFGSEVLNIKLSYVSVIKLKPSIFGSARSIFDE